MSTSSTNNSTMSWNIINNEIRSASIKKLTLIFTNNFINSVDELIMQQPKTEPAIFSFRESFPCEFLQIIHTPITKTEVRCTILSLKIKTHAVMPTYPIKILK